MIDTLGPTTLDLRLGNQFGQNNRWVGLEQVIMRVVGSLCFWDLGWNVCPRRDCEQLAQARDNCDKIRLKDISAS